MTREHYGSIRRFASFVAFGCLLGAATVGGTIFVSAAPASVSCGSGHANVEGYDTGALHYGNRGNFTLTQAPQLMIPKTISTGAFSPPTISRSQMTWK
jgi:hypothetical protein